MTAILTDHVDRAVLGYPASVAFTPTDEDGDEFTFATSPAPTAAMYDGAGTAVYSPTVTLSDDKHDLSFTVDTTEVDAYDTYAVQWTATAGSTAYTFQTVLEVCGGHYFTIAAFKAAKAEFASKSASTLRKARRQAEDFFETWMCRAWVPRGEREVLHGDGSKELILEHPAVRDVVSVVSTYDDEDDTFTAAEIADLEDPAWRNGILRLTDGTVWQDGAKVSVYYEHGEDVPDPSVAKACLHLAMLYASSDIREPSRATAQSIGDQIFRITVAGRDGPTGIPDIDAVLTGPLSMRGPRPR